MRDMCAGEYLLGLGWRAGWICTDLDTLEVAGQESERMYNTLEETTKDRFLHVKKRIHNLTSMVKSSQTYFYGFLGYFYFAL